MSDSDFAGRLGRFKSQAIGAKLEFSGQLEVYRADEAEAKLKTYRSSKLARDLEVRDNGINAGPLPLPGFIKVVRKVYSDVNLGTLP